jgi:putative PIN family toxin of toxin-antitoxin system
VHTVTLDTNIYISALEFGGTPLRLLRMAIDHTIEITISQPIIDETRRVLRDKFGWPELRRDEAEEWIRSFTRLVTPGREIDIIKEDPSDNRILECAETAGAAYIVSGDKDLLRVGKHGNVRIVRVAEMLSEVEGPDWPSPASSR